MRTTHIIFCIVLLETIHFYTVKKSITLPLESSSLWQKASRFLSHNKEWLIFTAISLPTAHFEGQLRAINAQEAGSVTLEEYDSWWAQKVSKFILPYLEGGAWVFSKVKPYAIKPLTPLGKIFRWLYLL